ncbi:hypothetical protein ALC53_14257 [Atta colombica]|uniref:Uncharacterized protein n=1 Tax=Atta colombica TaxID=520822 RepID=A0A195ATN4_9HYME|nr:hypothetical protein ALC53_14257 [Atta colombica]
MDLCYILSMFQILYSEKFDNETMTTSNDKTESELGDSFLVRAKRTRVIRELSSEYQIKCSKHRQYISMLLSVVILFSTRSEREMLTRTTVRLSRSDAIRNNGLLVRKDKVE